VVSRTKKSYTGRGMERYDRGGEGRECGEMVLKIDMLKLVSNRKFSLKNLPSMAIECKKNLFFN